jgi:hypothetical protein
MTEPCSRLADADFEILLEVCWEQIALFTYTQYKAAGRGVVTLERQGLEADILHDQVDLGNAVYEPGRQDADAVRMIEVRS